MADINSSSLRGLLVGGAVLSWALGLLWVLHSKGMVMSSSPATARDQASSDADEPARARRSGPGSEQSADEGETEDSVAEINVRVGPSREELAEQARLAALAQAAATPEPLVDEAPAAPPTYSVWFESERDIGVCKIIYEGGSKTANLHVDARLPAGKLSFSYRCGKYSGRASIDVLPKRVNGVLFCKDSGGVSVEQVRTKEARCGRG